MAKRKLVFETISDVSSAMMKTERSVPSEWKERMHQVVAPFSDILRVEVVEVGEAGSPIPQPRLVLRLHLDVQHVASFELDVYRDRVSYLCEKAKCRVYTDSDAELYTAISEWIRRSQKAIFAAELRRCIEDMRRRKTMRIDDESKEEEEDNDNELQLEALRRFVAVASKTLQKTKSIEQLLTVHDMVGEVMREVVSSSSSSSSLH